MPDIVTLIAMRHSIPYPLRWHMSPDVLWYLVAAMNREAEIMMHLDGSYSCMSLPVVLHKDTEKLLMIE